MKNTILWIKGMVSNDEVAKNNLASIKIIM